MDESYTAPAPNQVSISGYFRYVKNSTGLNRAGAVVPCELYEATSCGGMAQVN